MPTLSHSEALAGLDEPYPLTDGQVGAYRRDGFIQLNDVITGAALEQLRASVESAVSAESKAPEPGRPPSTYGQIFIQKVNLWQRHAAVRPFALSRRFASIAARLMGRPARMWHDQALFKEPRTGAKTPWHQDAVYWPHADRSLQTTIWLALRDATPRNGCMSFIPGTHTLGPLPAVNLGDPADLFDSAPQFRGTKPVLCPLRAGSCTFHHGLTFHYAGPNRSDAMREAFAIIYMPDGTRFDGAGHVVTGPLSLKTGDTLEGDNFPLLA